MSKFPEAIDLPSSVHTNRETRYKQLAKTAYYGILMRSLVILFELFGVVLINSSSLFLDAVSSIMDIISTLALIYCIKRAQKPPDDDHPFGHGRYEPLGGLLLGVLLIVTGSLFFLQQTTELFHSQADHFIHPYSWIFSAVAMVLMELTYRFVMGTAKKENSPALAADAVHYRIDGLSSLIATLALITAAFLPGWSGFIDHFGALTIAFFMIGLGLFSSRENFFQLMDKIPSQEFFDRVINSTKKVVGVLGIEKVRIQLYGPDAHVDIDVEVDPNLSVEKAHVISQKVRSEIQQGWPSVRDVTVHIEPFYPGDH